VLCLSLLAVVLGGCAEQSPPESSRAGEVGVETKAGGELSFGLASDPTNLNPTASRWDAPGLQVARAVYDPLLTYDESSNVQPYLATEVVPDDEFTTWTITVRDGVRFHDGSLLDAEAVKANLEASRLGPESGWLDAIDAIEVTGPSTVVVRCDSAWSAFPHVLAGQPGFMAAPSTLAGPATSGAVGTGPFRMEDWRPGERVRVARNPTYWQTGQPRLDAVDFRVSPDPAVRGQLARSGRVDVTQLVEPQEIAAARRLAGNEQYQVLSDPSGETAEVVVAMNNGRPPFNDPVARQAVAFSLDREAVARRAFLSVFPVADGPYSEGSRWFGQALWPYRDPAKVQQTLVDYRKEHGRDLQIELLVPDTAMYRPLAPLLRSQLADGRVPVTVTLVPFDELEGRVERGEYQAAVVPLFGGGHPDEDRLLLYGRDNVAPIGQVTANVARFRNNRLDGALDQSRRTTDITKQAEQYTIVQEELARDVPYVFLVHIAGVLVARNRVQGLATWTLPNGRPGISALEMTVALNQVWLA
jgi:peptide/nickel transport system substrate-binding protein